MKQKKYPCRKTTKYNKLKAKKAVQIVKLAQSFAYITRVVQTLEMHKKKNKRYNGVFMPVRPGSSKITSKRKAKRVNERCEE